MQGKRKKSNPPHLYPLPFARVEARQASQPHCSMLNDRGARLVVWLYSQESIKVRSSMWPDCGLPRQPV